MVRRQSPEFTHAGTIDAHKLRADIIISTDQGDFSSSTSYLSLKTVAHAHHACSSKHDPKFEMRGCVRIPPNARIPSPMSLSGSNESLNPTDCLKASTISNFSEVFTCGSRHVVWPSLIWHTIHRAKFGKLLLLQHTRHSFTEHVFIRKRLLDNTADNADDDSLENHILLDVMSISRPRMMTLFVHRKREAGEGWFS